MSENVIQPDPKYQRGCIYKLQCLDPDVKEIYVGSTVNLPRRVQYHRLTLCDPRRSGARVYQFIREHGGMDNWCGVLVEEFPCWSRAQLERRENYWFNKLNPTLNMNVPGLLYSLGGDLNALARIRYAQRKKNNPECLREYLARKSARHRAKYPEEVKARKALPYLCECGAVCQNSNVGKHRRTQKHRDYLQATYGHVSSQSASAGVGGDHCEDGAQVAA
jgi:hypothetical protein